MKMATENTEITEITEDNTHGELHISCFNFVCL
jgi:hypothetical protein